MTYNSVIVDTVPLLCHMQVLVSLSFFSLHLYHSSTRIFESISWLSPSSQCLVCLHVFGLFSALWYKTKLSRWFCTLAAYFWLTWVIHIIVAHFRHAETLSHIYTIQVSCSWYQCSPGWFSVSRKGMTGSLISSASSEEIDSLDLTTHLTVVIEERLTYIEVRELLDASMSSYQYAYLFLFTQHYSLRGAHSSCCDDCLFRGLLINHSVICFNFPAFSLQLWTSCVPGTYRIKNYDFSCTWISHGILLTLHVGYEVLHSYSTYAHNRSFPRSMEYYSLD